MDSQGGQYFMRYKTAFKGINAGRGKENKGYLNAFSIKSLRKQFMRVFIIYE